MTAIVFDEIELLVRDTADRFLRKRCSTAEVREWAGLALGFDRGWWTEVAELGWLDFGGASHGGAPHGSASLAVIIAEMLGRHVAPGPYAPVLTVLEGLRRHGAPALRQAWLDRLVEGQSIATWCAETTSVGLGSGNDVPTLSLSPGGSWMLEGRVSVVEAARASEDLLVLAASPDCLRHVLVSVEAPGVRIVPLQSLDLTRRFDEVTFVGVAIDDDQILPGDATGTAHHLGNLLSVLACAESVGAAWHAHDLTVEYMRDRYSFGRPLASYQALKHRLADQLVALHASAAAVGFAARLIDEGSADSTELCSVASSFVHDRLIEVLQDCVQLHGGIGVTWEHDLHLYLRRAAVNRCRWGTPEEHRERLATLIGAEKLVGTSFNG